MQVADGIQMRVLKFPNFHHVGVTTVAFDSPSKDIVLTREMRSVQLRWKVKMVLACFQNPL
jgi:hypothetical protein